MPAYVMESDCDIDSMNSHPRQQVGSNGVKAKREAVMKILLLFEFTETKEAIKLITKLGAFRLPLTAPECRAKCLFRLK